MSVYEPPLTVKEAAEFLRIHPETLRRFARDRNRIKSLRPSRRILLFWRTDLVDFLNGSRR
jgi:excisionase family DNA binding protein